MAKAMLVSILVVAVVELALTPFSDMIGGERNIHMCGLLTAGFIFTLLAAKINKQK